MSPCIDCPAAAELEYLRSELAAQVDATSAAKVCERLGLSPTQGRIVIALYQAKGRVLSVAQIAETATGEHKEGERAMATFRVLLHRVRDRIGHDAIITCPGFGYRLSPDAIARVDDILRT